MKRGKPGADCHLWGTQSGRPDPWMPSSKGHMFWELSLLVSFHGTLPYLLWESPTASTRWNYLSYFLKNVGAWRIPWKVWWTGYQDTGFGPMVRNGVTLLALCLFICAIKKRTRWSLQMFMAPDSETWNLKVVYNVCKHFWHEGYFQPEIFLEE